MPLRAIITRALRRRRLIELNAGRGVESVGADVFRIVGADPALTIDGASLAQGGWFRLRLEIKPDGICEPSMRLRYEAAGQQGTIILPSGPRVRQLIWLPDGATYAFVELAIPTGTFRLRSFEFQPVSLIGAACRLFLNRYRSLWRKPSDVVRLATRSVILWRREGLGVILARLREGPPPTDPADYAGWISTYDRVTESDRTAIYDHIAHMRTTPLISVLMPVYNPDERWLRCAIESVRMQLYPHWELCIADDASRPAVRELLRSYAERDPRIRVAFRNARGHIAAATNDALALARGELIALLDHDDELAEHALYLVIATLEEQPTAAILYTDEDKIDSRGRRFEPHFKPDFDPDLLLGQNMICHLGVYRRALVSAIGGFRVGYEGAQDYDLTLRISRLVRHDDIVHIPYVLYHWRAVQGSTALSSHAKGYAFDAARRAIVDHLASGGIAAEVLPAHRIVPYHRVRYPLPSKPPLVSVIVTPSSGQTSCVNAILRRTRYPRFELLMLDADSFAPAAEGHTDPRESCSGLDSRVRRVRMNAFGLSAIRNAGTEAAQGTVIAFIHGDLQVQNRDWLDEMVSHSLRIEIGAVGAMIYSEDHRIAHAGLVLDPEHAAVPAHAGLRCGTPGYFGRALLLHRVSAVSGAAIVMRRDVFDEIDGFDPELDPFADLDFCLKLRQHDLVVLWTPSAEFVIRGLWHPVPQGDMHSRALALFRAKWGGILPSDPFYNPNLASATNNFTLAYPPRLSKTWETRQREQLMEAVERACDGC